MSRLRIRSALFSFFPLVGYLALAGCIHHQTVVAIPSVLATLDATYHVDVDGQPAATATLHLANPDFSIHWSAPGRPAWDIHLILQGDGRLHDARYDCHGSPSAPCPGATAEAYSLRIPDAKDAPGYLGLGPFLGKHLTVGSHLVVSVWDPTGNFSVAWDVLAAAPLADGTPCVWLESQQPATPKTASPFFPYWGRLEACSGYALPLQLSEGKVHWVLAQAAGDGRWDAPPATNDGRPVGSPICAMGLPPDGPTRLPSNAYLDWARSNDDFIGSWFAQHPEGQALTSLGLGNASSTAVMQTYPIWAPLFLYDPVSATVSPRTMKAAWTETLLGPPKQEFQASQEWATASHVPTNPRPCTTSATSLDVLMAGIDGETPEAMFLAPELGRSETGGLPTAWPLEGAAGKSHSSSGFLAAFGSAAFPLRVYAIAPKQVSSNGGMSIQVLEFTCIDPGTGLVRWQEYK